jgi:hypothetical protein
VYSFGILAPLEFAFGLALAASIFQWDRHRAWRVSAIASAVLLMTVQAKKMAEPIRLSADMGIFWKAGYNLRNGLNPYDFPTLNTPNTLPLFELFSLVPLWTMVVLWAWFTFVGSLLMVPFSARVITAGGGWKTGPLPVGRLALLSILVTFSDMTIINYKGGQLQVLVALAVLGALFLRERGKPTLAGLVLSIAFMKINTALPLMPLFAGRKPDLKLLGALSVAIAAQCLVVAGPGRMPEIAASWLRNVKSLSVPGGGNDYAFTGTACAGIIGINHTLCRLGVVDRTLISVLHYSLTLALGCWLVLKLWGGRYSSVGAMCVFTIYSMIFLYHRIYDTILLALPLTYVFLQSQADLSRVERRLYSLVGMAIAVVHQLPEWILFVLTKGPGHHSGLVRAIILPAPFWMLLIALVLLDRLESRSLWPSRPQERG